MVIAMKKKILHQPTFLIGMIITWIMLLLTVVGFFYTPYDPTQMDTSSKLAGCSFEHIMGCDNFGRDIFSRVLQGMGNTFLIASATVAMRIIDVIFAFPSILLALVFVSIFGTGKYNVVFALGIAFVPSFARIVRSEFIKCKDMDYVKTARLAGVSDLRIMFVHILPNTMTVLLSSIMIGFNNAVLSEAGMSYLGIGVQPPDASLGSMLSEAQGYLFSAPNYAIFPGVMIILLVLGFSLMAEGLKSR